MEGNESGSKQDKGDISLLLDLPSKATFNMSGNSCRSIIGSGQVAVVN